MTPYVSRHIASDHPQVMIVDGSKVVRRIIERLLVAELPGVRVITCRSAAEARAVLGHEPLDFITIALRLPDQDGIELAHSIRVSGSQTYVPIVVVSGDVNERLEARSLGEEITDYFDKSLGFQALVEFIRGYVLAQQNFAGEVLYVEDSQVVALATRRMLEKHGLSVQHCISAEAALLALDNARSQGRLGADVLLTDVNLQEELSGADLIVRIREEFHYSKGRLPILVMTGDDNPGNQSALLRAGANDLVQKPIEERLLVTKVQFQMKVARHLRQHDGKV